MPNFVGCRCCGPKCATIRKYDSAGNLIWSEDTKGTVTSIRLGQGSYLFASEKIAVKKLDQSLPRNQKTIATQSHYLSSPPAGSVSDGVISSILPTADGGLVSVSHWRSGSSTYSRNGSVKKWDDSLTLEWSSDPYDTDHGFDLPLFELSTGEIVAQECDGVGSWPIVYSSSGTPIWHQSLSFLFSDYSPGDSFLNPPDEIYPDLVSPIVRTYVFVDSSDYIYLIRYEQSGAWHAVEKRNASGSLLGYIDIPDVDPDATLAMNPMLVDSAGNIIFWNSSSSEVKSFDISGSLNATASVGDSERPVFWDDDGSVYINKYNSPWDDNITADTTKLNSSLAVEWTKPLGTGHYIRHVDSSGNVYTTKNSVIRKFDSSGDLEWENDFGILAGDTIDPTKHGKVNRIITDADGNVYACGQRVIL